MIEANPLAEQCVYAMWALRDRGDMEIGAVLRNNDVHMLYAWACEIATRVDRSPDAQRVYAEAIALRIEGK